MPVWKHMDFRVFHKFFKIWVTFANLRRFRRWLILNTTEMLITTCCTKPNKLHSQTFLVHVPFSAR